MKSILNECVEKIKKNRHRFHKYTAIIAVLALITVVGVNVALRQDGISMSADSFFGIAETDEDPEVNADASTTADSDSSDASNSTDAGESTETTSESTDSDQTGDDQDSHVSDDGDSTDGKTKAEKLSDGDASAETDKLVDDSEDSQETKYSDDSADVESKSTWEKTIPSGLTGVWSDDLVKVAKSQIGYKESTKNFRYSDDGSTKQGYTRYGAWYGNKYGDWSAMFAAFCLHYADISDSYIPVNSGVSAWKVNLKKEDLYQAKGDYTPVAGDIVFLDNDSDGTDDHAAIIVSTSDSGFEAVEGDLDGAVVKKSFTSDDKTISGYLVLPENPDQDQATATTSLDQEDTDSSDSDGTEDAEEVEGDDDGALTAEDTSDYNDMTPYISGVSGSGTTYNNNVYTTNLTLNFTFVTSDVKANGYDYIYAYPSGVVVPEGDTLVLGQSYTLKDSKGEVAGTYGFLKNNDGSYSVFIHLDETYVSKAGTNMVGHVTFQGTLDKSGAQDDGSYKKEFNGKYDLVIPKDQITYPENQTSKYDITSSKTAWYDSSAGKLRYTVTITSENGTPGDVSFVDEITTSGMSLGDPTITIKKKNNQGVEEEVALDTVGSSFSNNKLTMTLLKMAEGSTYTVTYSYDVIDTQGDVSTAHNKVQVSSTDGKVTITDKDEKDLTVNNKCELGKSGSYDAAKQRIQWTISLNWNQADLVGSSLSDDMLAQLAQGTDVSISPANGYEIKKDANGKITSIIFTAVENGRNTQSYNITYYTSYNAGFEDETVKNTVVVTNKDKETTEKTATVTASGSVDKSVGTATVDTDKQLAYVPWTITITVPESGLTKGTVITDDTIDANGKSNNTDGTQYLTQTQVVEWAKGIYWADENGDQLTSYSGALVNNQAFDIVFKDIDGNSYSYSDVIANAGGKFNSTKFTNFTITLKNDMTLPSGAKKLIFKYNTTADLSEATGVNGKTYRNTVKVGGKSDPADYTYKPGFIKTDGNGNTGTSDITNSDKTLTWKLQATLSGKSSTITFTDTLPDGVNLKTISLNEGWKTLTVDDNGNITGSHDNIKATGTYLNGKLNLTLTKTDGKWSAQSSQTIILTCTIDTSKLQNYEAGKTYTFKNEASAKDDNGELGSDDQTQNWTEQTSSDTKKVVDKSGSWDSSTRQVNYTVKINPEGKDLLEGSDQLNLTDSFYYYTAITAQNKATNLTENFELSAWLLQPSVKLYKAKLVNGELVKDEEVTTWSWKVEAGAWPYGPGRNQSIITATGVPDETPLILEYSYQLYTDIPESGYSDSSGFNITNDLTIDGTNNKDTNNNTNAKWDQQTHSGGIITEKGYTIYKVDSVDYSKYLPGAEFELQVYQSDGTYKDTGYDYTTDSNGVIQVTYQKDTSDTSQYQYSENTLYRLVEKTAPENYNLPDNPEDEALYFYFGDKSATSYLPSTLPSNTFDLNKSAHVAYVENESQLTELTVNKRWFKKDGTEVTSKKKGSITFDLYRAESGSEAVLSGTLKDTNGNPQDRGNGTYAAGSAVTYTITATYGDNTKDGVDLTAPVIYVNGNAVECKVTHEDVESKADWYKYNHNYTFVYTFALKSGKNVLSGGDLLQKYVEGANPGLTWTYQDKFDIQEVTVSDYLVGTFTISSDTNWTWSKENLPASTVKDGVKVYYKYYVVENEVSHYDTTYDNNDGVSSGLITIKNTNQQEESYALPEAGGGGTTLYTTVGIILMGIALLYGIFMRYRRRRGEV